MVGIVVALTIVCIALTALAIWGIVLLERCSDLVKMQEELLAAKDRLIEALKKKCAAQEELNNTKDAYIEHLKAQLNILRTKMEVDNENP